jgi:hypothetical protein
MAIRADWHEGSEVEDGPVSDPFALASSATMAYSPLSLDLTLDDIGERIKRLFRRERFLFDMGIECPIKDKCDTSCLACPLNEANNPDSSRGRLCKVGVEQEQAETMHAVLRDPDHAPTATAATEPTPEHVEPEPQPSLKW